MLHNIIMGIFILDALMLMSVGILGAYYQVTDKENQMFWDRIWPASWMVIGTSFGAAAVLVIGNFVAGYFFGG